MNERLFGIWSSAVADPDAACALSLGNMGAPVLVVGLQAWACFREG